MEFVDARASVKKKEGDQATETGSAHVLESVKEELGDQAVGAGDEHAHEAMEEGTGDMPVLVAMDEVRTGVEPVLETVEKKLGEQAIRTGDERVHEAEELRTGKEPVPADVEMGTGDMPVCEMEVSDSCYEDFSGDDFEKVGEFIPEETPQTPTDPAPEISLEQTASSTEPRRKRIKTPTGRTNLPWVRKLAALKAKTSSPSKQTPQK